MPLNIQWYSEYRDSTIVTLSDLIHFRSGFCFPAGPVLPLFLSVFLSAFTGSGLWAQPAFLPEEPARRWADSVYAVLSPAERLGQLFMVAAYSNRDVQHSREISRLIRTHGIGGLIFFQGGPGRQAALTNRYQSESRIPLLIGMDAEWGLGMRLDSVLSFPRQMTLGAIPNGEQQIRRMGQMMARHCRRLGVHINFSPVADVNSNPANPVIGYRSFGEDRNRVAACASALARGLQDGGVMAVAKHFPGHGDADADSHYSLPVIKHTSDRIQEIELHPFRRLIADSVGGVMVAHLQIPALEPQPGIPTTFSRRVVQDMLRKSMGFEGLIFTDALNMKGASKAAGPGLSEVKALQAGCDVLLFPEDVEKGIQAIEQALLKKQLRWRDLEKRIRRILMWKFRLGLVGAPPVSAARLATDLNESTDKVAIRNLYAHSLTLVRNRQSVLPVRQIDSLGYTSILVGGAENVRNPFQEKLSRYAPFRHHVLNEKCSTAEWKAVLEKVRPGETVFLAFGKVSGNAGKDFGIGAGLQEFVRQLAARCRLVSVVFGNPYSLGLLEDLPVLVCAYEWNAHTQGLVPEMLFGAIPAGGKLPVSAGKTIKAGLGFGSPDLRRLRWAEPEEVGLRAEALARIDSFANAIVASRMTPGCQILVARQGAVIYEKSFGFFTYDSLTPVSPSSLYDIASITKVAATLQAVMYLQEHNRIDLFRPASHYLPELKGTNKESMLLSEILVHQAGLQPFIPYWKRTLRNAEQAQTFFCDVKDNNWFCTEVVPGLYSMKTMEDTLWNWVIESELLPRNRNGGFDYKYSDLGYYILKQLVERILEKPLDVFLEQTYYQPLGLERLTFVPKRRFPETEIAPTEKDTLFRRALIRGNVHDPGAAMFGGVAGHAGLFSNAYSLAVLMQMHLNLGYYGGRSYHLPQTIPLFSSRPFPRNRRGFGWDKPYLWGKDGPSSSYCSPGTYGHTGFTGTCVWADPEYDLIFVFLSNRVYPDAENNALIRNSVRPRMHDMVYEAMVSRAVQNTEIAE